MPITYLRISVCYEVGPFAVVEKLERKVDIPCQGHIKVTDQYKTRHDVAWYKRIFSRLAAYSIYTYSRQLAYWGLRK